MNSGLASGGGAGGPSSRGPTLSDRVVELVESGVSIIVGTCNLELEPECARGLGARVADDRRHVSIILNGALASRVRADLAATSRIAVGFSRIHDHHSMQLKGRVTDVRPGTPEDAAWHARYLIAFGEQLSQAGLPRSVVRGVRCDPVVVVTFAIEEVFDQTPGPGAGERLHAT